jgi:hypothetical protein
MGSSNGSSGGNSLNNLLSSSSSPLPGQSSTSWNNGQMGQPMMNMGGQSSGAFPSPNAGLSGGSPMLLNNTGSLQTILTQLLGGQQNFNRGLPAQGTPMQPQGGGMSTGGNPQPIMQSPYFAGGGAYNGPVGAGQVSSLPVNGNIAKLNPNTQPNTGMMLNG